MKYNWILDDQIDVLWHMNNELARENKQDNAHQIRENATVIAQLVREQRIAAYHAAKENEPQRHGAHPAVD